MAFLDKLKEQAGTAAGVAGNVAQSAAKQAKTLASIARVKVSITTEEDKIKKAYTEIGRLYYRDYAAHAEQNRSEYLPWCDKVDDAKKQISLLEAELERLRAEDSPDKEAEEPVIEVDLSAFNSAEEKPDETANSEEKTDKTAAPDEPLVDTFYVDTTNSEE